MSSDESLAMLLDMFESEHSFDIIFNTFQHNNEDLQKTTDALIALTQNLQSYKSSSSPKEPQKVSKCVDLTKPKRNPKIEKLRVKFLSQHADLWPEEELEALWVQAEKGISCPSPQELFNFAQTLLEQYTEEKLSGSSPSAFSYSFAANSVSNPSQSSSSMTPVIKNLSIDTMDTSKREITPSSDNHSPLPPPSKRSTVVFGQGLSDTSLPGVSLSTGDSRTSDIRYYGAYVQYVDFFKKIMDKRMLHKIWNSIPSKNEEEHSNYAFDFTLNLVSESNLQDSKASSVSASTGGSSADTIDLIDLTLEDGELSEYVQNNLPPPPRPTFPIGGAPDRLPFSFLRTPPSENLVSSAVSSSSSTAPSPTPTPSFSYTSTSTKSSSSSSDKKLNMYHYLQANVYEKSRNKFNAGKKAKTTQEAAIKCVLDHFEGVKLGIKQEEVVGILIKNNFDVDRTIQEVQQAHLISGNYIRGGISYSRVGSASLPENLKADSIRIAPVPKTGYQLSDLFNYTPDTVRTDDDDEDMREEHIPILSLKLERSLRNPRIYNEYNEYSFEVIRKINRCYEFKMTTRYCQALGVSYKAIEFTGFSKSVNIDDLIVEDYSNHRYVNLKEIDFHGLPVLQTLQIAESVLDYFNDIKTNLVISSSKAEKLRSGTIMLRFVVGKGIHSHKKIPKLGPALIHYLTQKKYSNILPYEGEIKLALK